MRGPGVWCDWGIKKLVTRDVLWAYVSCRWEFPPFSKGHWQMFPFDDIIMKLTQQPSFIQENAFENALLVGYYASEHIGKHAGKCYNRADVNRTNIGPVQYHAMIKATTCMCPHSWSLLSKRCRITHVSDIYVPLSHSKSINCAVVIESSFWVLLSSCAKDKERVSHKHSLSYL